MPEFKIIPGLVMPRQKSSKTSKYNWLEMIVGDGFIINSTNPYQDRQRVHAALSSWKKTHPEHKDYKVSCCTTADQVFVKRIA